MKTKIKRLIAAVGLILGVMATGQAQTSTLDTFYPTYGISVSPTSISPVIHSNTVGGTTFFTTTSGGFYSSYNIGGTTIIQNTFNPLESTTVIKTGTGYLVQDTYKPANTKVINVITPLKDDDDE